MKTLPDTTLAFLDLETTHLSSSLGEIVEIAIILIKNNEVLQIIEHKVKPEHLETAHPRAMEVNGYAEEKWENAISQSECSDLALQHLKNCVVVGHNISFDLKFIRALWNKTNKIYNPVIPNICTRDLSKQVFKQSINKFRLDDLRDVFGWSKENAHTALKDTKDCCKLFYKCISVPCPLDKYDWDLCKSLTDRITYT